jgi:glycosyltransferase involved in cell wall biosynthesis
MVVPCFNEAKRIETKYWRNLIQKTHEFCDWVFVNDGSTDQTTEKLIELCSNCASATYIDFRLNKGKAEAIREGLLHSLESKESFLIGYVDSDGAFDPEEIASQLDFFSKRWPLEIDCVFFSRVKLAGLEISRDPTRHMISRVLYTFLAKDWTWAPYDTQAGFKLFRLTPELKEDLSIKFNTRWYFELELIFRLTRRIKREVNILEIPVKYWKEISGGSISLSKFLPIFLEILRVRALIKAGLEDLEKQRLS